ncbi:glutathione synthase [Arenivirga flava]|uniref:Glutathione synthase n=2 Tax=Arenivirga flava TaxID=1930060 RepID=A0AA37XDI8_9MICO|nr:glutathione synthase [Arenivirga flava]
MGMTLRIADRPTVYILHENAEWLPPFTRALDEAGVPWIDWELSSGSIDLTQAPPEGVFWSRLSASSPSRGHAHAKEVARSVLRWLEAAGRRVINGSGVVEFEVSKVAQYTALAAEGFDVPRTIAVFGRDELVERARTLPTPFITKHNQGGKGIGVRRFDSQDDFAAYASSDGFEEPVDGVTLLQEHLLAAEPFVTRAEFIGGRFVYAVRVDTSGGSFELCPAEACAVPPTGLSPAVCDVPDAQGGLPAPAPLFTERTEITAAHPLIVRLEAFLAARGIEIAGVEFFETVDGRVVPYDVNTNTNYSPDVEAANGHRAARAISELLARELTERYAPAAV